MSQTVKERPPEVSRTGYAWWCLLRRGGVAFVRGPLPGQGTATERKGVVSPALYAEFRAHREELLALASEWPLSQEERDTVVCRYQSSRYGSKGDTP
jgi:hypothetical protein